MLGRTPFQGACIVSVDSFKTESIWASWRRREITREEPKTIIKKSLSLVNQSFSS
jgi:hypothetical protein